MENKKRSAKGFTLVELIVVITILAILGTIGFVSMQGYSASGRDSKRLADLRTLASLFTSKTTEWISLMNAISASPTSARLATSTGALGGTGVIYGADYEAGVPNYTALGISASNFLASTFKDPQGFEYRVGASIKDGGVFQVAARLEPVGVFSGWVAKVEGNYNARTAQIFSASGTAGSTVVSNLPSSTSNYFKKGDVIWAMGITTPAPFTVATVSNDSRSITLTAPLTAGTLTGIILGNVSAGLSENPGLIATQANGTVAVQENTANIPY